MVTTSSDRGLTVPTVNSDGNIWGGELNATINALDTILGGTVTLQSSAGTTVTLSSSQAQMSRVVVQGALPTNFTLTFASSNFALGNYQVWNNSSAGVGGVVCQAAPGGGSICTVNPSTMRSVYVDGINAQFADAQANLGIPAYVNKFRNGAMDIFQKGPTARTLIPSGIYTLDGWIGAAATGTPSVDQLYNLHLSGNALRINNAGGAATNLVIQQNIESVIAVQLLGSTPATTQPITIRFDIYNNSGADFTPQLAAGYAAARDNFGTVTNDLAPVNLQLCPNAAVTTVAYTFTPSANLANGYQASLLFGDALNGKTGTILITRADLRATPGVAAGINSSPPSAEVRPIYEEVLFCQRYLFVPQAGWWFLVSYATGGGHRDGSSAQFPTTMRAIPALNNPTYVTANCGTPVLTAHNTGSQSFIMTANGSGEFSAYFNSGIFTAEL